VWVKALRSDEEEKQKRDVTSQEQHELQGSPTGSRKQGQQTKQG